MNNEVREIDFGSLPVSKEKIRNLRNTIRINDKFGMFIAINILLYAMFVGLGILRLFGLV